MNPEQTPIAILFVDDEENILRSLQRLLMDEDFPVLTAGSGEAGLQVLKDAQNVGVIISDQRMPGMNGAEFLGRSRDLAPDAVRILLTGYSDVGATIDAINKGGACRYISKPWNDEELVQTIRDAVRQYALLLENRRLQGVIEQQNAELQEWNKNLKDRVLEQTTAIRRKNEELNEALGRIRGNYAATIAAFSSLVELQGGRTRRHSRNVANLATGAAEALGLSGEEIDSIRIGAFLHDIGKIGIPERILAMPPEAMNEDELRQYQQHPVRAQMTIDMIEELRPAGVLIRHHHENFDGSGYPDRLAGEAIPLGSRLLAFADFLDRAMETAAGDTVAEQAFAKAGLALDRVLDPALLPHFRKAARGLNLSAPATGSQVEVELTPGELKEGMLLARDVYSGSGILLLSRGAVLDPVMLKAIRRNYQLDAPDGGVFVLV